MEYLNLTLFIASIPIVLYIVGRLLTPKLLPGIPHLQGQVPLLGDVPKLAKHIAIHHSPTAWFDSVIEQLGRPPVCQVTLGLGKKNLTILVNDVQEAEDILMRRTAEFDRSQAWIDAFGTQAPTAHVALPTNAMWKNHRRFMGPTFSGEAIKRYAPIMSQCVEKVIKLWEMKIDKMGDTPGYFKAWEDFTLAAMDIIVILTFGYTYGCADNAIEQVSKMPNKTPDARGVFDFDVKTNIIFNATEEVLRSFPFGSAFPKLSFFLTSLTPKYRRAAHIFFSWIEKRIAESRARAKERGEEAGWLADCVVDGICAKEVGGGRIPDLELRDELFQLIGAGEETNATTLAWGVKHLAAHPEVQHKLHREIMSLGVDGLPGFDDVTAEKMPYLEAVVTEITRLARPISAVLRTATCDTTILGHAIPKGTTIYFSISILSSHPEPPPPSSLTTVRSPSSLSHGRKSGSWSPSTSTQFLPSRWLTPQGTFDPKAGPMLAFGAGPRACFGMKFAVTEMKLTVFQLVRAFFLERVPGELDGWEAVEDVTRQPVQSFVRPVRWESLEKA